MKLIILYAVILHYVWAVCLLIDPTNAGNATAMFSAHAVGPYWGSLIYFFVATAALLSMCKNGIWKPLMLLPQQAILCASALEATKAMWFGMFADGIERSHAFIIDDQSPAIIAMLLHTWAILVVARRELQWL